MPQEIGLFEAIYTQRAIRRFKADPIPEELIQRVIEAATRGPSGGNRQPWAFLVIRDPDIKRQLGQYYREAWQEAYGGQAQQASISPRVYRSASGLSERLAEAPVLILVCLRTTVSPPTTPGARPRPVGPRYASIYPAVQNLLLAARGLGLGAVLTTLHARYEEEVKELLGMPGDVETCALIPLGWPAEGEEYGSTSRRPVEEVIHYDTWGNQRRES